MHSIQQMHFELSTWQWVQSLCVGGEMPIIIQASFCQIQNLPNLNSASCKI